MSDRIRISGARDLATTLDGPADADAVVVACPPHPQMGGSRSDARLQAVADALAERDVACLRFDYGPWDEGEGEQGDVQDALAWAREAYPTVGLFGYSFGAGVGLLAAAGAESDPDVLSVLAPPATVVDEGDVVDAVRTVDEGGVPGQVVSGERDRAVDWERVVETARERGWPLAAVPGDHFFAGQQRRVATLVAEFVAGER